MEGRPVAAWDVPGNTDPAGLAPRAPPSGSEFPLHRRAPDRRSDGRVRRLIEGDVVGVWATARSRPNRRADYCRRLGERAIDVVASCHDMPPHDDPVNHDHPSGGPGKQVFMRYFHIVASPIHMQ
jgi:hypothetical protein